MRPEAQLAMIAALAGFLLKTSIGFCVCWLVSRAVVSPSQRFRFWLGSLFVASLYWLWLLASPLPHVPPAPIHALSGAAPVSTLQVQSAWASPLALLLRAIGGVYVLALAYFFAARIKQHARLRWTLQFTYKAPESIDAIFRAIASQLNIGHARVLMLSGIHSPATFGWRRPVILLPPDCEENESELHDILRHELQHVRRRDYLWNSIGSFCRALLCFHPGAWYAMRRMKLEGELACDLAVVGSSPERRANYAESLVRFARLRVAQEATPWNLDFAGSPSQLNIRVRSILAAGRSVPSWLLGLRAAFGLILVAGFFVAAPSLFVVLSYQQPRFAKAVSFPPLAPASTSLTSVSHQRVVRKTSLRASATPTVTQPQAAPIIPVEAANPAPTTSAIISPSDPTLKRRGDGPAPTASSPTSGKVILLSTPSTDSTNSLARGASVASAVTAVASEAAQVGSRGRSKDVH